MSELNFDKNRISCALPSFVEYLGFSIGSYISEVFQIDFFILWVLALDAISDVFNGFVRARIKPPRACSHFHKFEKCDLFYDLKSSKVEGSDL